MIFIKTRSGRFLASNHVVGFAIEEQNTEMEGQRVKVFNIIAYLPEPLFPAILSIYYEEETAHKELEKFVKKLVDTKAGIVTLESEF